MANYKFLEYIQSSGTQYINTGFKPNQDTSVIMDIELSNSNTQALFGARTSTTSKTFCNFWITAGYYRIHYNDNYVKLENSPTDPTIRRIIKHEKNTLTIANASTSRPYAAFQCAYNLALLAVNGAGTISYQSSAKLYSCQIYDNEVIIRDFHPAKRLSDNAVGLYDSINNVFYANAGTGTFTAGPELSIENFYACDYIESTGTQYIDTGFKHNQNTRVVMSAQLISPASSNWWLFGGRTSNYEYRHDIFYYGSSTKLLMTDYNSSSTNRTGFSTVNPSDKLFIDYNKNVCTINNEVVTHTAETFQCNYNLYLLAINTAGSASGYACAKLYSCQIYDNNALTRNYIPFCNEDLSLVGLYDSVTDSYFMNSGTGSFKMAGSLKPLTTTSAEEPEERTILYLGNTKANQIYANGLPVNVYIF